jgi:hypothetical protein
MCYNMLQYAWTFSRYQRLLVNINFLLPRLTQVSTFNSEAQNELAKSELDALSNGANIMYKLTRKYSIKTI